LNDLLVQEEPNADGASVGIVNVEVDGACTRLGDDAGCLPQDLLVCVTLLGMPRSATTDDVIPAPDSSSAAVSYPVSRKREQSLHTCAQDVQITRMATI
jgi:hypothetical protein